MSSGGKIVLFLTAGCLSISAAGATLYMDVSNATRSTLHAAPEAAQCAFDLRFQETAQRTEQHTRIMPLKIDLCGVGPVGSR